MTNGLAIRWGLVALLAAAMLGVGTAGAREPRAVSLLREHKCYICHGDDEPGAGPAFADIAAHYRGNPHAVAIAAAFIRRGEHGAGPWPMPPHPELSPAEARTIARYIVSLDHRRTPSEDAVPREPAQPATAISPRS